MKFIRCGAWCYAFVFVFLAALHHSWFSPCAHSTQSYFFTRTFRYAQAVGVLAVVACICHLGRPYYRLPNLNICLKNERRRRRPRRLLFSQEVAVCIKFYSVHSFISLFFHLVGRCVTIRRSLLYFHFTFFPLVMTTVWCNCMREH